MGQTLLAIDTVRYVGEPLAVVVTEDRYQGEDAAELVDVDYDALPPVVEAAAAAGSETLLFPDAGTNVAVSFGDASALAADLFDGCEVVVSRTIVNQRVAPAPMETRAAAASYDEDGKLTAWIPNQGAQGTRAALAAMLGVDQAGVRIVTPDVGGAFGAKFGADPEHAVVCWVARRLRPARPLDRDPVREPASGMTHGRAQARRSRSAVAGTGRSRPTGSRSCRTAAPTRGSARSCRALTLLMAPGPYAIDRAEAVAIVGGRRTRTPVGAYRGAGRPEATAAIERAMDLFAAEIGMDPAEVRRTQPAAALHRAAHRPRSARSTTAATTPAALDKALEAAGYDELRARAGRAARRRRRGAARHRAVLLRRDHRRRGRVRAARRRTPPSRCIPTAAPRS